MLRVPRSFLVIAVSLSLSLPVFSQTAHQRGAANAGSESHVVYGPTSVEWPASVPGGDLLLTVSGPQGIYLKQEGQPGSGARFSLVDEQGEPRPDGVYKWELVIQTGGEVAVESGWFQMDGGRVVAEGTGEQSPVVVEESAPANSIYVDAQGRVGLGTSVPGSQLHLKGTAPALTLEDTTSGGRAFTLRGLEKGDGSLGLFDQTTGEARWLVDSEGRIGINTTKPTSTLTVDGYIEATKGFLVNGKPVGVGFGLIGGNQPLNTETNSNNYFGINAGGTGGNYNSFFGADAGNVNTGSWNNFFGSSAGLVNNGGSYNNFFGSNAGERNTTGQGNSSFGDLAGYGNVTGNNNSFFGREAGHGNTASGNSFFGAYAGYANTTATQNAFFGAEAGYNNTGSYNSFFGSSAGYSNVTGTANAFFGAEAGYSNTASCNSVFGRSAGRSNTAGPYNSFFGFEAGFSNTSSPANSFFGDRAGRLSTGGFNSFFGGSAGINNTIGMGNSFFGVSPSSSRNGVELT